MRPSNALISFAGSERLKELIRLAKGTDAAYPTYGLAQRLKVIAQLIKADLNTMVYYTRLGGFDTHTNVLPDQDNLLAQLDPALGAFYSATQELGVEQNVVTFTESEFNRTGGVSGTNGSDHAWGGHHFVIGGAVKGGDGASHGDSHHLQRS